LWLKWAALAGGCLEIQIYWFAGVYMTQQRRLSIILSSIKLKDMAANTTHQVVAPWGYDLLSDQEEVQGVWVFQLFSSIVLWVSDDCLILGQYTNVFFTEVDTFGSESYILLRDN
jgi:hypothetical protein